MSDTFLRQDIGGTIWVCIRPKKRYSPLRISIQRRGYERLPALVRKGAPGAKLRLDKDDRLWISGLPEVDKLVQRVLAYPSWFLNRVRERQDAFFNLRVVTAKLYKRLTQGYDQKCNMNPETVVSDARVALQEWKKFHDEVFHLVLFNALVVDPIGEMFFEFLINHLGNRMALEHISALYRTPYAEESKRIGDSFHEHADIRNDTSIKRIPDAETDLSPVSPVEGEVVNALLTSSLKSRHQTWYSYQKLRLIAPLLVQLNDEQAYLWRAFSRSVMQTLKRYESQRQASYASFRIDTLTYKELENDLKNHTI